MGETARIIVVDDDGESIRKALSTVLEEEGYRVDARANIGASPSFSRNILFISTRIKRARGRRTGEDVGGPCTHAKRQSNHLCTCVQSHKPNPVIYGFGCGHSHFQHISSWKHCSSVWHHCFVRNRFSRAKHCSRVEWM